MSYSDHYQSIYKILNEFNTFIRSTEFVKKDKYRKVLVNKIIIIINKFDCSLEEKAYILDSMFDLYDSYPCDYNENTLSLSDISVLKSYFINYFDALIYYRENPLNQHTIIC